MNCQECRETCDYLEFPTDIPGIQECIPDINCDECPNRDEIFPESY
jgi:hypothetical protein